MIILIADDDKNIRFALKSMLLDIIDEKEITFFEASDGNELIKKCISTSPDLTFVDIKMPNLDGISAIEKLQKINVSTTFIILSGCSDFAYAKKCISLKVSDYLLKPVSLEDLSSLINKIENDNIKKSQLEKSKFKSQVYNLFSLYPLLNEYTLIEEPLLEKGYSYIVISFFYNSLNKEGDKKENEDNIILNLPKSIDNILPITSTSCHLNYSKDHIQCLIKIKEIDIENILKIINRDILNSDIFSSLSIKALYCKENTLKKSFFKAKEIEENIFISLNNKDKQCNEYKIKSFLLKEYLLNIYKICENLKNKDGIDYFESIKFLEEKYFNFPKDLELDNFTNSLKSLIPIKIEFSNQKQLIEQLKKIKVLNLSNTNDIVKKVKEYVEKNYMNNFGISQISDTLKLSPNYLSSVFHKHTSIKFIDYLNTFRLEKAKKLLISRPSVSIKNISTMVGYSNARYFSSLFKQVYGEIPSIYRKQYFNNL